MRVTNNMITNRVSYNLSNSISRYMNLQTQISSGRRINRPSDDPLGILRDLDYRKEISKNQQYQRNISQGQTWMQSYDTILSETNSLLVSASLVAETMANGTMDAELRDSAAAEVRATIDQILNMANTQKEGKYIFSGFMTDTKAIRSSNNGFVFTGDDGRLNYQIDNSSRMQVNLLGNDVFLKQINTLGGEADYNVALTIDTLLENLHNGEGIDLTTSTFTIKDNNLGISVDVDLAGATTMDDVITTINSTLVTNGIINMQAKIGNDKNNIYFETAKTDTITLNTAISDLNDGNAIDMSNGKIMVSDGAGTNVEIDLRGTSTIDDIIDAFNTQMAAKGISNVNMSINTTQNGLRITDSNGTPLNLTISDMDNTSNLAADLGIVGAIDPTLEGTSLDPQVNFEIVEDGGNIAEQLGILAEFNSSYSGEDLDPNITADSLLSDLNNGLGFDLGEIEIKQGDTVRNVDLGSSTLVTIQDLIDHLNNSGVNITASINEQGTGVQIINNDPNRSLIIDDADGGLTSKKLKLYGGADILGSLMALVDALESNDVDGIGLIMGDLQNSSRHAIKERAAIGAKTIQLESTSTRLVDQELLFTKNLSEIEDADLTEMITQLSTYENNYNAALIASSKIIQQSLLDFLR